MTGFRLRGSLIDVFWDAIVRGEPHPDATGIPPEQAETVRWFQSLPAPVSDPNRDRAWAGLEERILQQHHEEALSMSSAVVLAAPVALRPAGVPQSNGRPLWTRGMTFVSFAVLLALIGGLIFGIVENRSGGGPTVPAVIQGSPSPEASPLGSDWGQFRGGVERTGYTSDPGPGSEFALRWSFEVDESLNSIMEADGKVFAFGSEGGLYVLDALTGEQLWAIDLSPGQTADSGQVRLPAVGNGVVYVSTQDGVVVALDAEMGAVLWQSTLSDTVSSAPTISGDTAYVVTKGDRLHALDVTTGAERWSSALPSPLSTQSPAVVDGVYYYPADSGVVYALDAGSGEMLWESEPLDVHRVTAYQDGRLFVPTVDGSLVALDASNGTVVWSVDGAGGEGLNPVVTKDAVIVAEAGMSVRAFDLETGDLLWTLETPDLSTESPHAGGDTLYLNIGAQTYEAVDLASGELLTTIDAVGAGSTAAISGELLFVSGRDGPVRAFGPTEGEANAVQGSLPENSYIATPVAEDAASTESTSDEPALVAPVTGDIQLLPILAISSPATNPTLGLFKTPDGLLWRISIDGTVQIFDRDGNLLETRSHEHGSGPGQFDLLYSSPQINWGAIGVAWLDDGNTYVTDLANHRIQVFDSDGTYVRSWGSEGEADGQLLAPDAIVRSPDGALVVVDLLRGDLQWFDADGNFFRKLEGPAPDSHFTHPVDAAFDRDGNLWVLDHTRTQLFKFDPDGRLLLTIGDHPGDAPGQFSDPSDIEIDEHDRVWIADQSNERLQVFDLQGNLLGTFDNCGADEGCYRRPGIVVSGGNGFLYVLDYDPNGIQDEQIYKYKILSIPNVPIMAAATPAATVASPPASPTAG